MKVDQTLQRSYSQTISFKLEDEEMEDEEFVRLEIDRRQNAAKLYDTNNILVAMIYDVAGVKRGKKPYTHGDVLIELVKRNGNTHKTRFWVRPDHIGEKW
ncbi:MAG: hypothetical protein KKA68_21050 [Gammaproteobacteria bacterium]|nr:hypothetical protein [Gammaproteobacteria bacterium]